MTDILDDFNRGDENPLAGNWTILSGGASAEVVSNHCENASGTPASGIARWDEMFNADQEAYVTIVAIPSTDEVVLMLRHDGLRANGNDYEMSVSGDGNMYIGYRVNGTYNLLSQVAVGWSAGDKAGFRAVGNRLEGWICRQSQGWQCALVVNDSTFTNDGYISVNWSTQADGMEWDDFGGGSIDQASWRGDTGSGLGGVFPFDPTVLDPFHRADNASLGSSWTEAVQGSSNRAAVSTDMLTCTTGAGAGSINAFTLLQGRSLDIFATLGSAVPGGGVNDTGGPAVTLVSDTTQGYSFEINNTTTPLTVNLNKNNSFIGGTGASAGPNLSSGDKIGMRILDFGTYHRIEFFSKIGSGAWTRQGYFVVDGVNYIPGPFYPGWRVKYDTEYFDDFGGGLVRGVLPPKAIDSFNREDRAGSIGERWTPLTNPYLSGTFDIVSQKVQPSFMDTDTASIYAGDWPDDQYAQAKLAVTGTSVGTGPGVLVRGSLQASDQSSGYRAVVSKAASNSLKIEKYVEGAYSQLLQTTVAWIDGDTLRLEAETDGEMFSDDFNRSAIGSNWTTPAFSWSPTALAVDGQRAYSAAGLSWAYWNGGSPGPDCEVECVIYTPPASGQQIYLYVRCDPSGSTPNGYFLRYDGSGNLYIGRSSGGTETTIGGPYSFSAGSLDHIRFVILGSSLYGYLNGTLRVTATDTNFAGAGRVALYIGDTVGHVDNFKASAINGTALRAYQNNVLVGAAQDSSLQNGAPGLVFSGAVTSCTMDDFEAGAIEKNDRGVPSFPSTPMLDSFIGANETPIAENWTAPLNTLDGSARRIGNEFVSDVTGLGGAYYDVKAFNADCEAHATVTGIGNTVTLWARVKNPGTTGPSGYMVQWDIGNTLAIVRVDSGTPTSLLTKSVALTLGDHFGIRCIGDRIDAWTTVNGVWTRQMSVIDTTYKAGGWLAAECVTTSDKLDDFCGGEVKAVTRSDARIFVKARSIDQKRGTIRCALAKGGAILPFQVAPLDGFDRYSGVGLESPNWGHSIFTSESSLQLSSGKAVAASGGSDNVWLPSYVEKDVDVWVAVYNLPSGDWGDLYVNARINSPGTVNQTSYSCSYGVAGGVGNIRLWSFNPSTAVLGGSTALGTKLVDGDMIGLRVFGQTVQGWVCQKGVWTLVKSVTDPDVTQGGYVGLGSDTSGINFDNFSAGPYHETPELTTNFRTYAFSLDRVALESIADMNDLELWVWGHSEIGEPTVFEIEDLWATMPGPNLPSGQIVTALVGAPPGAGDAVFPYVGGGYWPTS